VCRLYVVVLCVVSMLLYCVSSLCCCIVCRLYVVVLCVVSMFGLFIGFSCVSVGALGHAVFAVNFCAEV